MDISWDQAKNLSNQEKHDLSFERGAELLRSGRVYEIYDGMYEEQEQRFIAFGEIASGVIGVIFAEYDDDHIRIISVRSATRSEVREYQKHMDTLS